MPSAATRRLHALGQSLWLDNITRDLLAGGGLRRYIDAFSVTGLTSNPTIFHQAIRGSSAYDADIRRKRAEGKPVEALFFDIALDDIVAAANLFRPVHERTAGVDGWVSLEVSPLLADDAAATLQMARDLHARGQRPNLLIKIPGTPQGLAAIEEATFAGIPINVTLLFSRAQYVAAAEAYLRGIERRIDAGWRPDIASVASLFISRWDVAIASRGPASLRNRVGIAIGRECYRAYRELLASARWHRCFNAGARPQRLLFASTGTKDPQASDVMYVGALAAPLTVDTMPQATLEAFADHGVVDSPLAADGGDFAATLDAARGAGIDLDELAADLQREGAEAFVRSWRDLLAVIETKAAALHAAA